MNARIADVLPLSPLQEGLLFHAARQTGGPDPYLVQARFVIGPGIGGETVRASVAALLDRHPNLRACFRHERLDRPVQVVPKTVRVPWTDVDLTGLTPDEADARTEEVLREDAALRFDMARPPLVRATFLRHDTGAELIVSFHHILLDGWSMPVVERDLDALVASGRCRPPRPTGTIWCGWAVRTGTRPKPRGASRWRAWSGRRCWPRPDRTRHRTVRGCGCPPASPSGWCGGPRRRASPSTPWSRSPGRWSWPG